MVQHDARRHVAAGCETAILGTDAMNCGGCGITCAIGETCLAGACVCGTTTGSVGGGAACAPIGDSCNFGGMCRCDGVHRARHCKIGGCG